MRFIKQRLGAREKKALAELRKLASSFPKSFPAEALAQELIKDKKSSK